MKNRVALRVARCELRVASYGLRVTGYVVYALRVANNAARIFEFSKPHKLNQLSQLNELYKRSERNHRTIFNDINK